MSTHIRTGVRTGIIFGIVLIFLILIGFQATAADLIGGLLGNENAGPVFGVASTTLDMMIFFGLLALWEGSLGARPVQSTNRLYSLVGALTTGTVTGLMVGLLVFMLGSLNTAGVNMSFYLAELLPATVQQFTLGLSPLLSAITYLIFLTLISGLAGLLAIGFNSELWKKTVNTRMKQSTQDAKTMPIVEKIRSHRLSRFIGYGILLLIVFLLPLQLGQYWNYTLGTVGIYVLLGLGLNIVVGLAGLLDLGYVAFFAIGAYAMALMTAPAPQHLLWSFWLVIPFGILLAAGAGILLGIPVLRMRGDYLAIVTLGFGEIIRILASSDLLSSFSGGPRGVPSIGQPSIFGHAFNSNLDFLYLIILAVILIIFVTNRLKNSHVGRAWESMREDESVARATGINTLKYKLLAFAIGAAFAGLGGALFASRNQFTGPDDHTLMVSINVLCLVIVGGMGSIPGVIAGAFVLKGLPEVLRQLQDYRIVTFGALLVVMMIIRPEGLIPTSRRRMELKKTAMDTPPPTPAEINETQEMVPK
jgi:branched-chain amino acid transport system permease protein